MSRANRGHEANPVVIQGEKSDYLFFDQYTLEEIPSNQIYGKFIDASVADKLIRLNYDIHTGAILGFSGKLLAFFASLICASLPVTGFYIWYERKFKKPSKRKPMRAASQHNQNVEPVEINRH